MKKSVNLRRKPRRASANDLIATFRRLGMSDEEIKAALKKYDDQRKDAAKVK